MHPYYEINAPLLSRMRVYRLDLEQLGRMAREFDQISRESGRVWPPNRFVADEWRASLPAEQSERATRRNL